MLAELIKTGSRAWHWPRSHSPSPLSCTRFLLDLATRVVYVRLYHSLSFYLRAATWYPLYLFTQLPLKIIEPCGVETVGITHRQRDHGVNECIQGQKEEYN